MDDLDVNVTVGPLFNWPDERVQRVYGLMTRTASQRTDAGERGSSPQVADLHDGAAQFGLELVRRGLV